MRQIIVMAGMLAMLGATSALARDTLPAGNPPIVQGLLQCRAITDATQRLACYDRQSNAIATAIEKKDLVVIDKERATAAKRSLFGFSVPSFAGLLGGGDLNQIEGTVAAARQNADGGWTIQLVDGSVWDQTDDTPVALEPRRGDKITVRRGALGSYFVKIGSQPGFKAKRIG
ncbi:MAG TPA: hypothetical protein VFU91_09210 [Sphingomicrobium sp.]|jgi:hypothetical protein|nr:hypothetical protein [Sphingomicrobium sp.]